MFRGKICPTKIILMYLIYYSIFRMNLFLPSLGIHYFSAFYGEKKKRKVEWAFPDGPVVKVPHFQCSGHRFNP